MKDTIKNWDLYGVTNLGMAGGKTYPEIVGALLEGGARVIQLRDKTSTFEELSKIGPELVRQAHDAGAQLLVNDNPYLACEIGADGVHVGQKDFPVDIARGIIGPDKILGLSTHTRDQALTAAGKGVDYIGLGPIFSTTTKDSDYNPRGLGIVRWVSRTLKIPFVCIGGITLDNLPDVLAAGATCCAVISGIMQSDDIAGATRRYREVFRMIHD